MLTSDHLAREEEPGHVAAGGGATHRAGSKSSDSNWVPLFKGGKGGACFEQFLELFDQTFSHASEFSLVDPACTRSVSVTVHASQSAKHVSLPLCQRVLELCHQLIEPAARPRRTIVRPSGIH